MGDARRTAWRLANRYGDDPAHAGTDLGLLARELNRLRVELDLADAYRREGLDVARRLIAAAYDPPIRTRLDEAYDAIGEFLASRIDLPYVSVDRSWVERLRDLGRRAS